MNDLSFLRKRVCAYREQHSFGGVIRKLTCSLSLALDSRFRGNDDSPYKKTILLLLALLVSPCSALATEYSDFVTLGGGGYNFDKHRDNRRSLDYRVEYAWGVSLLPLIADSFDSVEPFFQVHPVIGIEGNSLGAVYGNGGLNLDIPFECHGIFTWDEAVGVFAKGGDLMPLGAVVEFRSQLELGWQFDNALRITAYISHISNAHLSNQNPGAEVAGVYVHVPVSLLGEK